MLVRLLVKSLWKRKGKAVLVTFSVAAAAALISAFLSVAFQITEEMARELRSFGANIVLVPAAEPLEVELGGLKVASSGEEAYLDESELPRIKTIFWRHNITAFAPSLSRMVKADGARVLLVGTWFDKELSIPEAKRSFSFGGSVKKIAPVQGAIRTGIRTVAPWWQVEGRWPGDEEEGALVGSALARRLKAEVGGTIRLSYETRKRVVPVRGIVRTGGAEEDEIIVPLRLAQNLLGLGGKVDKVRVSALVTPDNALAARASRIGPANLPPQEYETWYCSPYLSSIIYQLQEAIPASKGKAVRQVSEAEGSFLFKMRFTFALVAAVALLVAAFGVMATMVASILERRQEIGLMKALGAEPRQIRLLFLLEGGWCGLAGGLVGYLCGLALARLLLSQTFAASGGNLPPSLQGAILLVALVVAGGAATLGSFFPVRGAVRLDPVKTLRES